MQESVQTVAHLGGGRWAGEHLHMGALVASRPAEEAEPSPG